MRCWVEQRKATRSPEEKKTRDFTDSRHHHLLNMSDTLEGISWFHFFWLHLVSAACWSSQKHLQSQQEISSCKVLVPQTRGEHKLSVITWFFSPRSLDFSCWLHRVFLEQTLCITLSDSNQQPPVLLLHSKCTIYPHMLTYICSKNSKNKKSSKIRLESYMMLSSLQTY